MTNFLIIDNGTRHLRNLKQYLSKFGTVVRQKPTEIDPKSVPRNTIIMLSGSRKIGLTRRNAKHYEKEMELIKQHRGPLIGICLGAQLIAHTYGSHLHAMQKLHRGMQKITDLNGETYRVYEAHQFSILKVKKPLQEIARSEDGVEIFRHRTKLIYGLQFHPEVYRSGDGRKILDEIMKNIIRKEKKRNATTNQ